MTAIIEEIWKIRQRGLAKSTVKPKVKWWRERDYINGEVEAGVIILPTRGCAWGLAGGCAMCGYVYDSYALPLEELLIGFRKALKRLEGIEYLKVFNSGSFFDPGELSAEVIGELFSEINKYEGIRRVQVEARPEFLNLDVLQTAVKVLQPQLEIGIGLESARDYVREKCVNKGFTFEDFKKAVKVCAKAGIEVKAYLLVKPLFLTEKEAIDDAVYSAVMAHKAGASRVSLNPVAVHKDTLVEELWKRGEYSPPWLWSIVEILLRLTGRLGVPILCHPTGAGKPRGAHNCGKCDDKVYKAILNFSASQDDAFLTGVNHSCSCRDVWKTQLFIEGFAQGSFPIGLRRR